MMKQNRRYLLTAFLCAPFALQFLTLRAEAKPQWEEKWYPVKDGRENKLYVRFGTENGKRYRQWGNGYNVKVKFTGYITYRGNGRGLSTPDRTFTDTDTLPLAPGAYSLEGARMAMQDAELLDITAVIE